MLKQTSVFLLRQFFDQRGELQDLPWGALQEHRSSDLVYHAWQGLPDGPRRQVNAILQDIWDLSQARAIRAFAQELHDFAPERSWEFAACRTRLNKALWFYLNFPGLY